MSRTEPEGHFPSPAEEFAGDVSQTRPNNYLSPVHIAFDPTSGAGMVRVFDCELAETGSGPSAGTLVVIPTTFQRRAD
jgi:hypothetical protein